MRVVLTRLREQELYVKLSKCAFMQREVEFLGHRIGADGLRVAPDKISAVRSGRAQERERRALVPRSGQFLSPLREGLQPHRAAADGADARTTRRGVGSDEQREIRRAQGGAVLAARAADARPDEAVRAQLRRVQVRHRRDAAAGSRQRPAACRLSSAQDDRRRSATTTCASRSSWRSCDACSHWRHYLHGTQPFTLLTDHDSLKYHKTMPNLTGRLARWVEKMAEFDYKIEHIPGAAECRRGRAVAPRRSEGARRGACSPNAVRASAPRSNAQAQPRGRPVARAAAKTAAEQSTPAAPTAHRRIEGCHRDAVAAVHGADESWRAVRAAHREGPVLLESSAQRDRPAHHEVDGPGRRNGPVRRSRSAGGSAIDYTGDRVPLEADRTAARTSCRSEAPRIDAARTNAGEGRWVNDPRGTQRPVHTAGRYASCLCADRQAHQKGGGDSRQVRCIILAISGWNPLRDNDDVPHRLALVGIHAWDCRYTTHRN